MFMRLIKGSLAGLVLVRHPSDMPAAPFAHGGRGGGGGGHGGGAAVTDLAGEVVDTNRHECARHRPRSVQNSRTLGDIGCVQL
jgi:hypothetical protein